MCSASNMALVTALKIIVNKLINRITDKLSLLCHFGYVTAARLKEIKPF